VLFVERYSFGEERGLEGWKNLYGLKAGDAKMILDVVPP